MRSYFYSAAPSICILQGIEIRSLVRDPVFDLFDIKSIARFESRADIILAITEYRGALDGCSILEWDYSMVRIHGLTIRGQTYDLQFRERTLNL